MELMTQTHLYFGEMNLIFNHLRYSKLLGPHPFAKCPTSAPSTGVSRAVLIGLAQMPTWRLFCRVYLQAVPWTSPCLASSWCSP